MTDGFGTPITSGLRSIGATDEISELSWSSLNATACEGDGFTTANNSSGTLPRGNADLVILAGQTRDFAIRCRNTAGVWSPWQTVQIVKSAVVPPPPNRDPEAPLIRGVDMSTMAPSNSLVATPVIFTIQSTDPDNDNLFYQIDWDADGVSDMRLPGSGYIASGVPANTTNVWPSAGNYTLNARAIDQMGNVSNWTSHTIRIDVTPTVAPLPLVLTLQSDRDLIRTRETTMIRVQIRANYEVTCTISGVEGGPVFFVHSTSPIGVSYPFETEPLDAAQEVTITCLSNVPGFPMPEEKRSLRVNVVPEYQET